MAALSKIQQAGFTVALVAGGIEIKPASKLNPKQRDYLKANKAEIIAELEADEAANDPHTTHPIQPNDTRRFCRQCLNHRPVKGRPPAKIRCEVQDRLWLDDIPRHCDDFMGNGDRPPVIGVRWTPEPINRHTATGTADQANQNITDGSVTKVNHAYTACGTSYPRLVDCYTPNGGLIRIMAENQGRAEWLQKMNPKPRAPK